jgi:hypothetical protein
MGRIVGFKNIRLANILYNFGCLFLLSFCFIGSFSFTSFLNIDISLPVFFSGVHPSYFCVQCPLFCSAFLSTSFLFLFLFIFHFFDFFNSSLNFIPSFFYNCFTSEKLR